MQIDGITALVTGAASGLGAATARYLRGLGAKVALIDFNIDAAQTLAEEIGGLAVQTDVSDEASVEAAVAQAVEKLGAPRLLVNCAGIAPAAKMVGREGKLGTSVFARTIGVNLIGSYNMMCHAARAMLTLDPLENGERGVIINTASIAAQDGQMGQTAYAASKGAVASMSLPAARDMARDGIRVMAIAPGLFHTPMMEGLPDEVTEKITANIPFPARLGSPTEYASLVQHIAENAYLNGEVIRIDGATRLPPR